MGPLVRSTIKHKTMALIAFLKPYFDIIYLYISTYFTCLGLCFDFQTKYFRRQILLYYSFCCMK